MAESKIAKNTKDAIIIKDYSAQITVGASSYGYATANALGMSTPSGYTPMAFVSFSSDSTCPVYNISTRATGGQGAMWVKNVTAQSHTFTVMMSVAYIRTDLLKTA